MNETLDELSLGNLKFLQAEKGYRFSLDPVLLARFAAVRSDDLVVDLGTGCGVLPLLLVTIGAPRELVGVEVQPDMADRARRNVELNGQEGRVRILHADLRQIRELLPVASADLVVSNPPYRAVGNGRISPRGERAAARHELAGGLPDFVAAAAWLLKNGGRFAVVYLVERLAELMVQMVAAGIEPKRLRMVHPRQFEPARMVLVEGRKCGRPGLAVEQPLYVYRGAGRDYSDEVLAMYQGSAD